MILELIVIPAIAIASLLALKHFYEGYYLGPSPKLIDCAKKIVLITGCDSGFGFSFAFHFHKLGFMVVACVLNEYGGGAKSLKGLKSDRMKVLKLDLGMKKDISSCYVEVENLINSTNTELWALINNGAVTGYVAEVEMTPYEILDQYFKVNVLGTVTMTKRFLPMLKKSKGRIVNISSLTGSMHLKFLSAYSATKSALNAISNCLRQELYDTGVKVSVVQPSAFVTAGLDETFLEDRRLTQMRELEMERESNKTKVTNDERRRYACIQAEFKKKSIAACCPDLNPVIRVAEHAVTHPNPKSYYPVGYGARMVITICSILPTAAVDWLIRVFNL